jgi:hypothetical protein
MTVTYLADHKIFLAKIGQFSIFNPDRAQAIEQCVAWFYINLNHGARHVA